MPSGERSQVWYPSVVALLRSQWRTDMTWEGAIELRARLQRELDDHQRERGIVRATVRCRDCGAVDVAAMPRISIRSMLISLRRFSIEPEDRAVAREREWNRFRVRRGLDAYGAPIAPATTGSAGHEHRKTDGEGR
jgi:hypothetical protein